MPPLCLLLLPRWWMLCLFGTTYLPTCPRLEQNPAMRKPLPYCLLLTCLFTLSGLAADAKLKPNPLAVNTDADEDEPHVADGGVTLYYGVTVKGQELVNVARRRVASGPWGKATAIDAYVTNKGDVRGVSTNG